MIFNFRLIVVFSILAENAFSKCVCHDSVDFHFPGLQCRCFGNELKIENLNLGANVSSVAITDSDVERIDSDAFAPYRSSLNEIILSNLHSLTTIEAGAFRDIPGLRTVYITEARKLKYIPGLFLGVTSRAFKILRIIRTGLMEIPDLSHLHNDNILHLVDLDQNKIEKLPSNSFKVNAEQITLNFNEISEVEPFAFNGSQIASLSFKGNLLLKQLPSDTFTGLKSLRELDLSETSIGNLPTSGLDELEVLEIENVPSMKTIPSVYNFPHLRKAYLTHHFHCCAFKYPKQHDPERHALFERRLAERCAGAEQVPSRVRKKRSCDDDDKSESEEEAESDGFGSSEAFYDSSDSQGEFHSSSADISSDVPIVVSCGNLTKRSVQVACRPEPDALNPCEDIMGSAYLRVSVWFVVVLAVAGNLAVIVVVAFGGGELTVSRFLMSNLALADLCMGLYLLLVAAMDARSVGTYFNYAFDWQYGTGCQLAGFLTVFASQLSIFTLTVLTIERWFAIAYAIYLTRRIRLGVAAKIMIFGWLYSILMAAIPLMGVSNYSSTSICLPMEAHRAIDKAYLASLVVTNGLAFALVVFCYAQIYFSLGRETRRSSTKGELTIARKMALLVFTDFACWAPVAFFAATALAGYPLIGVTRAKVLLVFFYPLNSCANPYLYAITTAQYRKDFFALVYRCGICRRRTQRYALNSSIPTTNYTHLLPGSMGATRNGRDVVVGKLNGKDDAFV